MTIQERLIKVEENFNELKKVYTEKEASVSQLQSEIADIEKQLIFMKGAHQALAELLEDQAAEHVEAEVVE